MLKPSVVTFIVTLPKSHYLLSNIFHQFCCLKFRSQDIKHVLKQYLH